MRILASPAFKNSNANPYNAALYGALQADDVTVCEFSKKRVFLDSWDIVHIHWPDTPLHCNNPALAFLLAVYHILRLHIARSLGAKIVWTVHNLQSHNTAHPLIERLFWKSFLPLVDASIHLSRSGLELALHKFPKLASLPHFVIPHGHYRDCYPNERDRESARTILKLDPHGQVIAFVGQIKPYKNVTDLARAFLNSAIPQGTLLIAGKSGDTGLERELNSYAGRSSRIICHFGLIPEEGMQNYLNACNLAVFPYRDILNSGSAILALSFDRPVLVPAKGAMAELQELIGSDWVMTYEGGLTGDVLRRALRWAGSTRRPAHCDLSALEWAVIAGQTHAAYTEVTGGVPVTLSSATEVLP